MRSPWSFFQEMTPATKGNILKGTSIAMCLGSDSIAVWFALLEKKVISGPTLSTELEIGICIGLLAVYALAMCLYMGAREQHKGLNTNTIGFAI